jgi:hypothetical protein
MTIYAIPRKGFCPPMTVDVDNIRVFVPPYAVTGKSRISPHYIKNSCGNVLMAISI